MSEPQSSERRAQLRPAVELPDRLLANARLLPRRDAVLPLIPKGGRFVEVGVAMGEFSELVLEVCEPADFVAIDTFTLHELPFVWGMSAADRFGSQTHREVYERRFAAAIAEQRFHLIQGDSVAAIGSLVDSSVDLMYLDTVHSYDVVAAELAAALPKMRDAGMIMLNDYMIVDVSGRNEPYGVAQATHDFMLRENWEMVYFALHPLMYCDVVLRRKE